MKVEMVSEAKSELLKLMKRKEKITVKEGAEYLDLAISTIRQHLMGLQNEGFVECADRRQGVGRPKKVYFLTEKGERLFPSKERDVFPKLVEFLLEEGCHQDLERFFHGLCEEFGREMTREVRGKTSAERFRRIEEFLAEGGFSPESYQGEDGDSCLVLHHCPYESIIGMTQIPCECERRSMEELMEAEVELETSIARGDSSCRFRFRVRWKG